MCIYIYTHTSGTIRLCHFQEISATQPIADPRRKPRVVTKRLLGQRRKATLLGWLESGRNWSASGVRSVLPSWWRLWGALFIQFPGGKHLSSHDCWRPLLDHLRNKTHWGIWKRDNQPCSDFFLAWKLESTPTIVSPWVKTLHPKLLRMRWWPGNEQIQRPKTQMWRSHQSSPPSKFPQVVQMKYVIQPKITISVYAHIWTLENSRKNCCSSPTSGSLKIQLYPSIHPSVRPSIHTYIHTLHYITLHYITLHYITLHYITLHYITLHYITLIHTLHYITLHYITLHYITLHYITLHYITLHYITLHYITLHYITYIHTITLHYITLHTITLHYITLHYITLHTIPYHYITLHYIHYLHTGVGKCPNVSHHPTTKGI